MYRAATLYREATGCGARIRCEKRIPAEAGMGGGSADAAAVLRGLQRLHRMADDRTLKEIALRVGADVPFCLHGGLVRTRGIGELLEDHPCAINYWLLVFQPCRALSTREIFAAYHAASPVQRPNTGSVLTSLESGSPDLLATSIGNVLEPLSAAACPEIPEAVAALKSAGAFAAQMTGSGSAVFGAFRSRVLAEKALASLGRRWRTIHLCHTQSDSVRIMEE